MSGPDQRRSWWLSALLPFVLFAACEPRKIEIEGLDELTSEIRSQRMRDSRGPAGTQGSGEAIPADQIQAAMSPLREVLSQLAASQKDLSNRQATLTKEMQQWTHLLVQSMQETRATEANKLSKRLKELEQSIAAQDERHRQVEQLLGSALDRTADQLEEFLRRVGAGVPSENTPPTEASGTPGANGTTGTPPPKPTGNGGQPAGAPDPASGPASGGESGGEQQASLRWLWWTLALMSVASGLLLLRGRRRPRPVAMAPEMQFAPATPKSEPESDIATQAPAEALSEPLAAAVAATKGDDQNEPDVEELWAAAALLGEAIGRLKQSGEGGGEVVDAGAPPGHTGSMDELALDEMFVIDERHDKNAEQAAMDQPSELDAIDALGLPVEPEIEPVADIKPVAQIEPVAELEPVAGIEQAAEVEKVVEIPRPPAEALTEEPSEESAEAPPEPVAAPIVQAVPEAPTTAPEAVRAPAARHASEAPVTCRVHLRGDDQTEGRVRQLLGSDPRVLISPAPRVHNAMGELEVSFALLPGLPAGERSLLEQQLRDTVA